MILATVPDPTVRPPSRYQTGVLRCANGDLYQEVKNLLIKNAVITP